ncbi:uncharacterized protein LOC123317155 [Coccinella septempunctata]|uniref:uncharacterized protein LOC123317155 n=1 Tax=Coccinella septempunctata TaxID=41139 RepID=UPI001D069BED|nr:uncharacterized protein LOC123317155 [Coccinella septempunctata]
MGLVAIAVHLFMVVLLFHQDVVGYVADKRSTATEKSTDDFMDYQLGVKYDEYPMIVPKKRTAMLVDRLMVALKEAIDEEEAQMGNAIIEEQPLTKSFVLSPDDVRTMDLQRRGHGSLPSEPKVRPYWRCYFNAVTCF